MKDGFVKVAAGTPRIRVADTACNAEQIIALMKEAAAQGVKVLCLPELCLTGYTCGDLFLQPTLLDGAEEALETILTATAQLEVVTALGLPVRYKNKLYNCAAVIQNGQVLGLVPKTYVPNYGEFYEGRWFAAAPADGCLVELAGETVWMHARQLFCCENVPNLTLGVEICEDLWTPGPPSDHLAKAGATLILNLSASNEVVGKADYRRQLVTGQSSRLVCGYIYASAGEGESTSDLIFGGHDLIAEDGALLAERRFTTGLAVSEMDVDKLCYERRRKTTYPTLPEAQDPIFFRLTVDETTLTRPVAQNPFLSGDPAVRDVQCEEILTIAALGLKKRLEHTGTAKAVIGLSGGLDSTLAILITARAMDLLGRPREDILAVTMPCFGTTRRTRSNAEALAQALGATLQVVDITAAVEQHFRDIGQDPDCHDVTYENAQARERTQVLMDLSNRCNGMVIGTGDLSELALGWCTYNGDHMSMYAVNGSIPKTVIRHVVSLAARTWPDQGLAAVLEDILGTPVSPELLPAQAGDIAQKTEDLVGPYQLHDFFLYYAVGWGFPPRKIYRLARYAFAGGAYDSGVILKWLKTFYRRFFAQQFKRSCMPDGPKVGQLTFSPRGDWRMPSDAVSALWLKELEELE